MDLNDTDTQRYVKKYNFFIKITHCFQFITTEYYFGFRPYSRSNMDLPNKLPASGVSIQHRSICTVQEYVSQLTDWTWKDVYSCSRYVQFLSMVSIWKDCVHGSNKAVSSSTN